MPSYQELRKSYPEFIYKNYKIEENSERVRLEFQFEIPGLSSFSPYWEFPRKKGIPQATAKTEPSIKWPFPWEW